MSDAAAGLIVTGLFSLGMIGVLLFVGDFNMKKVARQFRAIMRLAACGKVPRLCSTHTKSLIQSKGKMALIDDMNCEICTKRSKLI